MVDRLTNECRNIFEDFMRDEYGYLSTDLTRHEKAGDQYSNWSLQCNWRLWKTAWEKSCEYSAEK